MLVKILLGVVVVLALFAAVAATRPSAYHVERTLEIAAPPEAVFGVLDDLHRFAGVLVLFGTPLEQADPNLRKTFAGPAAGVGQSYAWSGNRDAGRGRVTIVESDPARKVGMKLEFVEPMKSTSDVVLGLAGTPTGTLVAWSMDGEHHLVGKALGMFMNVDAMLGADLEKGLARLKAVAEDAPTAAASLPEDGKE